MNNLIQPIPHAKNHPLYPAPAAKERLASNTRDLAFYTQVLFKGGLFEHPETIDLIFTEVGSKDFGQDYYKYRLGVMEFKINGRKIYDRRGFWGTCNLYDPQLIDIFS